MRTLWILCVVTALGATALADPVVSITLVSSTEVAGVGGHARVRVQAEVDGNASDTDGLFSYDISALFDAPAIAGIANGSVSQPGSGTPMSGGTVDATGLTACYGTYFYEQGYGINEPKELVSFNVVGLSPGAVQLSVTPDTTIGADFLLHESSSFTVDYLAASLSLVVAGAGDTNGDRVVDAADYTTLKRSYGIGPAGYTTWRDGDFDHNGVVDRGDLLILAENMGTTYAGSAGAAESPSVPEPSSLLLLSLLALSLPKRAGTAVPRKRRR